MRGASTSLASTSGASTSRPRRAPAAPAAPAAGRRRRRRADDQQDALFASEELTAQSPARSLTAAEQELVAAWDLDAGLLLAERDRQRRRGEGPIQVMLPARLPVSATGRLRA